jgi:hypothetical protein
MDGVQLCARFSIATNRLEYCGPAGAEPGLYRAITEGQDLPSARDALARFEALMPYLEAIGAAHHRDPFDRRVVEAYWLGNELLDSFERREFVGILDRLTARGLPRSLAARLVEALPARPIPHHLFHVGFVGVGNVTGHVPTTLANMEACRPSWAEVRGVFDHQLDLLQPHLALEGERLVLAPAGPLRCPHDPKVVPDVAPGDTLALHWGLPALKLDPEQATRLRRYSELALAAANEALPRLGVFAPGRPPEGPPRGPR